MSDDEALQRVRALAEKWVSDGAEIDQVTGQTLLAVLREESVPPGGRRAYLRGMAEGWMTPGASFYSPVAGQQLLNALDGEEAVRARVRAEIVRLSGRLPMDDPLRLAIAQAPLSGLF